MLLIVFDLESRPDPFTLPREDADPSRPERMPALPHHEIVAGAVLGLSVEKRKISLLGGEGALESEIIYTFHKIVRDSWKSARFYGFNTRGFDLPLMRVRAMRHGISVPLLFHSDFAERYRATRHVDMLDVITLYGASTWPSADGLARMIGWPGKLDVDGRKVGDLWNSGKEGQRSVYAYVQQDVAQEAAILLRLLLVRGELEPEAYGALAGSLLALVDSSPALAPLREKIDRKRFLHLHKGESKA